VSAFVARPPGDPWVSGVCPHHRESTDTMDRLSAGAVFGASCPVTPWEVLMRIVTLTCAGIALLVLCVPASALSINPLLTTTATNEVEFLAGKLLAPTSNVTVLGTNQSFVGILGNNTTAVIPAQSGWYTGFNLVPSFGPNPAITNPDGIFLTTGNAEIAQSNTSNAFSNIRGTSGDSDLGALLGLATLDANSLEFDFTVASGYNAVAADFVFGTEEWSEYPDFPDIFAFFVDGMNYASSPTTP
jgi:hypothetical protein